MQMRDWMTAIGLSCGMLPGFAHAALGGNAESVRGDRAQMTATLQVRAQQAYSVHEMTLPSGTIVREFVSVAGVVFGVAWRGPLKPDLQQLLGDHFDQAVNSTADVHPGHSMRAINREGLVFVSAGHMRGFLGKAYLPPLLPPGVTADDIQ